MSTSTFPKHKTEQTVVTEVGLVKRTIYKNYKKERSILRLSDQDSVPVDGELTIT